MKRSYSIQLIYNAYNRQRSKALRRGIRWGFTLNSWCRVWYESGHWPQRGPYGFVMARFDDAGPYSPENVQIVHSRLNNAGRVHKDDPLDGL